MFALSLANLAGETFYLRAPVIPETREVDYGSVQENMEAIFEWLADPANTVVIFNAPFDRQHLEALGTKNIVAVPPKKEKGRVVRPLKLPAGWRWRAKIVDPMVMAHVVDPSEREFGAKYLSYLYCDIPRDDEAVLKKSVAAGRRKGKKAGWRIAQKHTHGKGHVNADFWLGDPAMCERYSRLDSIRAMRLYVYFEAALDANTTQGGRLRQVLKREHALTQVVLRMTEFGVNYKPEVASDLRTEWETYKDKQEALLHKKVHWMSPSSWHHKKRYFIDKLGLTTERNTPKGNPQINADQLLRWARGSTGVSGSLDAKDAPDGNRVARMLLEWSAAKKYLEFLNIYDFHLLTRRDGTKFLRPSWRQVGPVTGRFACSDPNVMQIADEFTARRHSALRPLHRRAFGPGPGRLWYSFDYSQFEVWIFVFLAQMHKEMRVLQEGGNIHSQFTEQVWGDRPDLWCGPKCGEDKCVNPRCVFVWYRGMTKVTTFTKLYGGGTEAVSRNVHCSKDEAYEIIARYDRRMPRVPEYQAEVIERIQETGKVTCIFGREIPVPMDAAYRGVNYEIQGSQAEFLKRAMIRSDRWLKKEFNDRIRMLLTLHDELVFDLPEELDSIELQDAIADQLQKDSHRLPGNKVPLPVSCYVHTKNWAEGEKREIAKFLPKQQEEKKLYVRRRAA